MSNQYTPIVPTTEIVENQFVYYEAAFMNISNEASRARFQVWLEDTVAAAEQRGAERGWDRAIDYAWNDSSIYEADAARAKSKNPYRADQEGAQGE